MPAAIPVVAAIAGALAASAFESAVVGAIVGALVTAAVSMAGSLLLGGLNPNKSSRAPAFSLSSPGGGRDQMIRQPVPSWKLAFGRVLLSGALLLAHTAGSGNQYLYLVLPLCAHPVDAIEQLYINERAVEVDGSGNVTTAPYSGYVKLIAHAGAVDQAADTMLTGDIPAIWTSDHRLRGHTYLAARLTWKASLWPGGIPNLSAVVRAMRVYDPRTGTTAWSRNAVLCLRQYLTYAATLGGYGLDSSRLQAASWIAGANTCDEQVALKAGGTVDRYTCDYVVDTAAEPATIIHEMLTACGGRISYPGGSMAIHPARYDVPVRTLNEDMLRAKIVLADKSFSAETYNAVKGTFIRPLSDFQPVGYPVVTSTALEAEDGGWRKWLEHNLPATGENSTAQRLAKIERSRSRQRTQCTYPANFEGLRDQVMDTVYLDYDPAGWSGKVFRVPSWRLADDDGVDISLQSEDALDYAWDAASEEKDMNEPTGEISVSDPTVDTDPPALQTNLQVTGGSGEATATWTNPADEDYWRGRLYYSMTADIATASNVDLVYGFALGASEVTVPTASGAPLSAGTWYFWLRAEDVWTNLTSNAAGPVSATVT